MNVKKLCRLLSTKGKCEVFFWHYWACTWTGSSWFLIKCGERGDYSWGERQEEGHCQVRGLHNLPLRLHHTTLSADKTNPAFIILSCVQRQTVLGIWNANHVRGLEHLQKYIVLKCLIVFSPQKKYEGRLPCHLYFNYLCQKQSFTAKYSFASCWHYCHNIPFPPSLLVSPS